MEAYIKTFLEKFIAELYTLGISSIPFAGEAFQKGVVKMQESLKKELSTQEYEKISDIFLKTPVQEMYNKIRDWLMDLNGDKISFVGADNPYWKTATIKMNPYYANKILSDYEICDIDNEIIKKATEEFCNGAGVLLWEEY